jgi:NADH-quinone oxidoreductase subunit H
MKFGMFYFAEYMEVCTSSMLLVTIFLGGWELPFIHRDGITIAFGTLKLFEQKLPHVALIILSVLVFFGKTLAVCLFQAFIRWSLPRFRYDQLMKLGWRVLLPASLTNILVTGAGLLAVDHASLVVQGGLKVAADVSQAFVAALITVGVVYATIGMFRKRTIEQSIVGSSAKYAARLGGTKETAMQA